MSRINFLFSYDSVLIHSQSTEKNEQKINQKDKYFIEESHKGLETKW